MKEIRKHVNFRLFKENIEWKLIKIQFKINVNKHVRISELYGLDIFYDNQRQYEMTLFLFRKCNIVIFRKK